jgi:hypothetical protein
MRHSQLQLDSSFNVLNFGVILYLQIYWFRGDVSNEPMVSKQCCQLTNCWMFTVHGIVVIYHAVSTCYAHLHLIVQRQLAYTEVKCRLCIFHTCRQRAKSCILLPVSYILIWACIAQCQIIEWM